VKHLADVAREAGLEPGRDIKIRMLTGHFGEDKPVASAAWGGIPAYDWYGVGDTGIIAGEGIDQSGLYVLDDAHYLELLDIDSDQPVADGALGNMVVTVLFKDDIYPMIRFNTHDVTAYHTDTSPLGLKLRRIRGFLGRSDNMVKLRGINVFPQAIGTILSGLPDFAGDYICRVTRDVAGRDDMTVLVEAKPGADVNAYRATLKAKLGVELGVELKAPRELSALTGIDSRQKPIRLLDERKKT
jgi:phenylacetate-CoA ligase